MKTGPLLYHSLGVCNTTRLGGYLGHRRKSPIGIQVLWRGWLQLESLCEGWQREFKLELSFSAKILLRYGITQGRLQLQRRWQ